MKKIIKTRCDCEWGKKAHRYYPLFVINESDNVWAEICPAFIGTEINNEIFRKNGQTWKVSRRQFIERSITNLLAENNYAHDVDIWMRGKSDNIFYATCNRPYIICSVTLDKALEMIVAREGVFSSVYELGEHTLELLYDFWTALISKLTEECNRMLQYKKYKYQEDNIRKLLRKLPETPSMYQFNQHITELIIQIFNLKINEHEAS